MFEYDAFGRKYEFKMLEQYSKLLEELRIVLEKRKKQIKN
jgi:hypothetical protein